MCGVSLACLAIGTDYWLEDYGGFWRTLPHGLLRVGFAFSCGVLMYRLRANAGLPQVTSRAAWLLPAALVLVAVVVPVPGQIAELLAMLVALPGLLWLATKWEVPQTRFAAVLSDMSYPLYCIHVPLLMLAWNLKLPNGPTWAALIALSMLLDRWWDRPVRRIMRGVAEGNGSGLSEA